MKKSIFGLGEWLLNLFDPPPLKTMTQPQKMGRVLLLSVTLIIASIIFAMLCAVGLFLVEKGMKFRDSPEFIAGVGIILLGVIVNSTCLLALILIKRADHRLIPPPAAGSAMAKSEMEGQ